MSKTLGDVLPSNEAAMLTDAAKGLSKAQLAHIMSKTGSDHHELSQADIDSLTALAVHRVNNGDSMFGFSDMKVTASNSGNGPNQNW